MRPGSGHSSLLGRPASVNPVEGAGTLAETEGGCQPRRLQGLVRKRPSSQHNLASVRGLPFVAPPCHFWPVLCPFCIELESCQAVFVSRTSSSDMFGSCHEKTKRGVWRCKRVRSELRCVHSERGKSAPAETRGQKPWPNMGLSLQNHP